MSKITEILERFGAQKQGEIREALSSNRINASGRLSDSITYKITDEDSVFGLEISADNYFFKAVQVGTSPNEAKKNPIDLRKKIDKWIVDKPVQFPGVDRGTTNFLITRKIINKGTDKWIDFGSKGKTSGILEDILTEDSIDKLESELVNEFENVIIEGFVKFE